MTTIVTRAGKGSPLTNTEMDANLTNLNNDKVETSALASYAPLASPAFSGTPTSVTPSAGDTSTKIATTAFVSNNFAALAGANTFTAKQTFGEAIVEGYEAIASSNIDTATGAVFSKTISGTTTFTVSNTASSGSVTSFILELTNGGAYAITWWSGIKWAGGTVPTLTTSGVDILGFYTRDGGTTWRGLVLAKDSK
jgi:hypothetical protein